MTTEDAVKTTQDGAIALARSAKDTLAIPGVSAVSEEGVTARS